MIFPSPQSSRKIEKTLDPRTRADLARLRYLIKHAPSWLAGNANANQCLVIQAVMEDFGSSCTEIIFCEMRVVKDEVVSTHKVSAFNVFDQNGNIFVGPRAERDPEFAAARALKRGFRGCEHERISTWEKQVIDPSLAAAFDPRNSQIGRELIDQGLALLESRTLKKTTPAVQMPSRPRQRI